MLSNGCMLFDYLRRLVKSHGFLTFAALRMV